MMKQRGFTLIEMLIVATLIGILTVAAYGYFGDARRDSQVQAQQALLEQIKLALEAYGQVDRDYSGITGSWDPDIVELLDTRGYISANMIRRDVWGGIYIRDTDGKRSGGDDIWRYVCTGGPDDTRDTDRSDYEILITDITPQETFDALGTDDQCVFFY